MTGRLTLYGASHFLGSYFGRTTEPPEVMYLAVMKDATPNAFLSGSELDEPDDLTGYIRVEIPNDDGYWHTDVQPQIVVSGAPLTFPIAIADWGRVRYWGICDAPADGNLIAYGDISDVVVIEVGQALVLEAGNLAISLGPFALSEES